MKTMAQIDALYEAEINKAKLEGELQGEARGEARGEQRQQQTIALNMLHKNIPIEIIAEVTGLTVEQLQEL